MKSYIFKFFGLLIAIMYVIFALNINYSAVAQMPNNLSITLNDLGEMNDKNTFGSFVSANVAEDTYTVGKERKHNTYIQLKLFGIIPIRNVEATIYEEQKVYLGGIPLGFAINSKGLIVIGQKKENGKRNPFKSGDIITKIDDNVIEKPSDAIEYLSNLEVNTPITITVLRGGEEKYIVVIPNIDEESGEKKLGLWVRDDAQGIGTLTFVTKDGKFGALGHAICDYETGAEIPVKDGGIYICNIVGINKAQKGKAGELRCLFSLSKTPYGEVDINTKSGVFGSTENKDGLVDKNLSAEIGSRMIVKLGKAKLVSSVSGIRQEYDIEIIKTKYQPSQSDKSFVFRVIDKNLISLTGGIVQGMSGSPIIQNGKLIGAVTHVFINDATKGYGIYVDWMMQEIR
ncbi:MAG: SpoIVB peptidase [Clostridia bacterium]|nr:SpoIVB peptidase [Clostridia bacterium]